MEQDLQWSPDKEDQIGVHPNHFNATQKFVEKRNLHINIQRSHKGDDYTTMGRRSELEERQQGGYERKPTDASKGTVHTFEPSQYEPKEATTYRAHPSRFQLTRTEKELNKFFTYISLEAGPVFLQIPTTDKWGMTTDRRGVHITIAYLADMDDKQLRDLSNKLKEVLATWWTYNEQTAALYHFFQRPHKVAPQRLVWRLRRPPLQGPDDIMNKKLYVKINILDYDFHELMNQIETGETRLNYDLHDHKGKTLTKKQAAHVAFQWALDQQQAHFVEETQAVHSIHNDDDAMKFVYLGTSRDNKLAEGSELRPLLSYLRTAIRQFGLAAMPPDYGNAILPPERLHVTPPTQYDVDIVQIEPVPEEIMEHLNNWKGTLILAHMGTPLQGHNLRGLELTAPTPNNKTWPQFVGKTSASIIQQCYCGAKVQCVQPTPNSDANPDEIQPTIFPRIEHSAGPIWRQTPLHHLRYALQLPVDNDAYIAAAQEQQAHDEWSQHLYRKEHDFIDVTNLKTSTKTEHRCPPHHIKLKQPRQHLQQQRNLPPPAPPTPPRPPTQPNDRQLLPWLNPKTNQKQMKLAIC